MVQGFNLFYWFKGSTDSSVQGYDWKKKVQLLHRFNYFQDSNCFRVHLFQGFNWFKDSIGSRVNISRVTISPHTNLACTAKPDLSTAQPKLVV